jgi:uncharacterized membrane protein HdeD (DUF308 family)
MGFTQPQPMLAELAGNWWAFLLRGIAAVLFGLAVPFWPRATPFVFIALFGSYTLVDGILALVAGTRGSGGGRRWPLLVEGVLGVVAGIAFFWPRETVSYETVLALLYVLAGWAIFTGILEVAMAISLRRERERDPSFLMGLSGGLSVLFGVLLAALPGEEAEPLVWLLIGIYGLIFGIALIALGVRVRGPRQGSGRVR